MEKSYYVRLYDHGTSRNDIFQYMNVNWEKSTVEVELARAEASTEGQTVKEGTMERFGQLNQGDVVFVGIRGGRANPPRLLFIVEVETSPEFVTYKDGEKQVQETRAKGNILKAYVTPEGEYTEDEENWQFLKSSYMVRPTSFSVIEKEDMVKQVRVKLQEVLRDHKFRDKN
ncbi:MAG: hypothetical protein L3J76_02080 [Candidatus Hydrothermae bacterium]|nr:hypothetical protein [Candidatus Hydrothermae bacterium]